MKEDQIVFKMLFREEIFDIGQVRDMIKVNPNVAYVVYQTKNGTHRGERQNLGSVDGKTLLSKYG